MVDDELVLLRLTPQAEHLLELSPLELERECERLAGGDSFAARVLLHIVNSYKANGLTDANAD